MDSNRLRFVVSIAGLAVSCSAGDGAELKVGTQGGGGSGGAAMGGSTGGGGSPTLTVDGGNQLLVHIEDPNHVVLEVVTLSCQGECADVLAVARGGHLPYTYRWEDGSTNPARRLCPTATSRFTATVTDAGISSAEVHQDPETRQATVTAEVLGCGTPQPDAGNDAGTSAVACFGDPSFEGPVTPTQFEAFSAPPWNACYAGGLTYSAIGNATLWPQQNWTFPTASDGTTYLALGQQLVFAGRASQTLCAPIHAGESRSFLVDLARAKSSTPAQEATEQAIRILGGTSECQETDVLWTSPQLTPEWATYCVTLRPQQDVTTLGFRPTGTAGALMEALVDHIVPVARCQ